MIDVTLENFETEVIAASHQVPVLVDFWAPWCGPCKTLGPLLEKVEADYGGRFKLVKIDSDQEQQLAQAFGIRSIPTCVLMINGKPADGFMGAVPESKLKEFLDKHVPSEEVLEAEAEVEDAQALAEAGDPRAALQKLHEALTLNPGNDDARYDYVKLLIESDMIEDAEAALEIIMRDKAWNSEVPRKTFVAILELLTPPKPKADPAAAGKAAGGIEVLGKVVAEQDPQAQLVASYRRKLSMALN
jgi:putative thioredoxin